MQRYRAFNGRQKGASFFKNELMMPGKHEIVHGFLVGAQPPAIGLVSREVMERDQSPGLKVGAFPRQPVSDQPSAATRNDSPPVLSVSLKGLSLQWIDFVAYEAGDRHVAAPST